MKVNKVLFITQEMTPYVGETEMSLVGRQLPQAIQEEGREIRTFMPKWGNINERRNQLHEVIRLSGMNLIIDDTDHPLIIKVATLQPARLQVYFIFSDDYFSRNICKDLETVTSPDDNDERSIFFVRGVFETVKKLRWEPDIVHCGGWITALAAVYLKKYYHEDSSFRDTKVVYSILGDDLVAPLDARMAEKLKADGIDDELLNDMAGKPVDYKQLTMLAIANSDGVVQRCENLDPDILQFIKDSGKPFLPYDGEEVNAQAYIDFYKSL